MNHPVTFKPKLILRMKCYDSTRCLCHNITLKLIQSYLTPEDATVPSMLFKDLCVRIPIDKAGATVPLMYQASNANDGTNIKSSSSSSSL